MAKNKIGIIIIGAFLASLFMLPSYSDAIMRHSRFSGGAQLALQPRPADTAENIVEIGGTNALGSGAATAGTWDWIQQLVAPESTPLASVSAESSIYTSDTPIQQVALYLPVTFTKPAGAVAFQFFGTRLGATNLATGTTITAASVGATDTLAYAQDDPIPDGVHTLTMTPPIDADIGDMVSFKALGYTIAGNASCYKMGALIENENYSASFSIGVGTGDFTSGFFGAMPMKFYGQAPHVVLIGDSRGTAYNTTTDGSLWGFKESATLDPYYGVKLGYKKTYPWIDHVARQFGWTYSNLAKSQDTTEGMLARFTADVINHKPAYVIIAGGYNDWSQTGGYDNTPSNIAAMCTAALGATPPIIPIVCSIDPDGAEGSPANILSYNAAIKTEVDKIAGAIWIDNQAAMGTWDVTAGGYALRPEYYASESDKTHYNVAGNAALGASTARQIKIALSRNSASMWVKRWVGRWQ